jgi:hypothetical protein
MIIPNIDDEILECLLLIYSGIDILHDTKFERIGKNGSSIEELNKIVAWVGSDAHKGRLIQLEEEYQTRLQQRLTAVAAAQHLPGGGSDSSLRGGNGERWNQLIKVIIDTPEKWIVWEKGIDIIYEQILYTIAYIDFATVEENGYRKAIINALDLEKGTVATEEEDGPFSFSPDTAEITNNIIIQIKQVTNEAPVPYDFTLLQYLVEDSTVERILLNYAKTAAETEYLSPVSPARSQAEIAGGAPKQPRSPEAAAAAERLKIERDAEVAVVAAAAAAAAAEALQVAAAAREIAQQAEARAAAAAEALKTAQVVRANTPSVAALQTVGLGKRVGPPLTQQTVAAEQAAEEAARKAAEEEAAAEMAAAAAAKAAEEAAKVADEAAKAAAKAAEEAAKEKAAEEAAAAKAAEEAATRLAEEEATRKAAEQEAATRLAEEKAAEEKAAEEKKKGKQAVPISFVASSSASGSSSSAALSPVAPAVAATAVPPTADCSVPQTQPLLQLWMDSKNNSELDTAIQAMMENEQLICGRSKETQPHCIIDNPELRAFGETAMPSAPIMELIAKFQQLAKGKILTLGPYNVMAAWQMTPNMQKIFLDAAKDAATRATHGWGSASQPSNLILQKIPSKSMFEYVIRILDMLKICTMPGILGNCDAHQSLNEAAEDINTQYTKMAAEIQKYEAMLAKATDLDDQICKIIREGQVGIASGNLQDDQGHKVKGWKNMLAQALAVHKTRGMRTIDQWNKVVLNAHKKDLETGAAAEAARREAMIIQDWVILHTNPGVGFEKSFSTLEFGSIPQIIQSIQTIIEQFWVTMNKISELLTLIANTCCKEETSDKFAMWEGAKYEVNNLQKLIAKIVVTKMRNGTYLTTEEIKEMERTIGNDIKTIVKKILVIEYDILYPYFYADWTIQPTSTSKIEDHIKQVMIILKRYISLLKNDKYIYGAASTAKNAKDQQAIGHTTKSLTDLSTVFNYAEQQGKRFFINNAAAESTRFNNKRICSLGGLLDTATPGNKMHGCSYQNPNGAAQGIDVGTLAALEYGNMMVDLSSTSRQLKFDIQDQPNTNIDYKVNITCKFNQNFSYTSNYTQNITTQPKTSAANIHRDSCKAIVQYLESTKKADKRSWQYILENNDACKEIMSIHGKKAAGDGIQVIEGAMKFGGLSGYDSSKTPPLSPSGHFGSEIGPFTAQGEAFRMQASNDITSSVFYMLILLLIDGVNPLAFGGLWTSASKVFIIPKSIASLAGIPGASASSAAASSSTTAGPDGGARKYKLSKRTLKNKKVERNKNAKTKKGKLKKKKNKTQNVNRRIKRTRRTLKAHKRDNRTRTMKKNRKGGKSVLGECHIEELPNNNLKIILGRRKYVTKNFDISPESNNELRIMANNPETKNKCIAWARIRDKELKELKKELRRTQKLNR